MIKTQPNVGFTLQYSLRWSNGIEIDLRKQTGIKFDLILPDDTSVRITGLGYDSFQNKVWVRVPAAHTTAEGVYRASLSVMTKDLQLISTGIHDIAEIDENATSGYQSITLRMDVVSVDTPVNMGQGYSPKIANGEWYVFDDSQQSYVPTGVVIVSQASIDSAVNAEKALREAADTSLQSAIAAEATRAAGKEQELDAKINAQTSDIALSQLSESLKQYIEASGGGTITNMPDEEDLTVTSDNKLRLKDRVNYHIVRPKIKNGQKIVDSSSFVANAVNEIREDAAIDGFVTVPQGGTIKENGGRLTGGSLSFFNDHTKNKFFDWDVLAGANINTNSSTFAFDNSLKYTDAVYFDVQNMQGYFSRYNLTADSLTDNSNNLNGLFSDRLFTYISKYRKIVIVFTRNLDATYETQGQYLFKTPIKLSGNSQAKDVEIRLYADLIFNFEELTPPTKSVLETTSGTLPEEYTTDFNCFTINGCNRVSVIGFLVRYDNNQRDLPTINSGFSTIIGNDRHYYEGLKRQNGTNVYNSFSNHALSVTACQHSEINGVKCINTGHGINTSSNFSVIRNCIVDGAVGDNGITVSTPYMAIWDINNGAIVENCYCKSCRDIGISVQIRNSLVINCVVEDCGNNNNPLSESFGEDMTMGTGGGFSVETWLSTGTHAKANVTFINCTIKDCYNYAINFDDAGITLIDCKIDNVISTYNVDYEVLDYSEFKYSQQHLRKRGIIAGNVDHGVRLIGCTLSNVPDVTTGEVYSDLIGCTIESISTSSRAKTGKCTLVSCIINADLSAFTNYEIIGQVQRNKGTSSDRPTNVYCGFQFYDTTLGKPIWWNGTNWVDATGTTV